jgi:hypothetical protein
MFNFFNFLDCNFIIITDEDINSCKLDSNILFKDQTNKAIIMFIKMLNQLQVEHKELYVNLFNIYNNIKDKNQKGEYNLLARQQLRRSLEILKTKNFIKI